MSASDHESKQEKISWKPFPSLSRKRNSAGRNSLTSLAGNQRYSGKRPEISKLRESLTQLSEATAEIFQDVRKVGGFQLKEIKLQVEISAEGGVALVGTAKAGAKGAITLTFQP